MLNFIHIAPFSVTPRQSPPRPSTSSFPITFCWDSPTSLCAVAAASALWLRFMKTAPCSRTPRAPPPICRFVCRMREKAGQLGTLQLTDRDVRETTATQTFALLNLQAFAQLNLQTFALLNFASQVGPGHQPLRRGELSFRFPGVISVSLMKFFGPSSRFGSMRIFLFKNAVFLIS